MGRKKFEASLINGVHARPGRPALGLAHGHRQPDHDRLDLRMYNSRAAASQRLPRLGSPPWPTRFVKLHTPKLHL